MCIAELLARIPKLQSFRGELVLNVHQAIVLGDSLTAGRRTGLEVTSPHSHSQVCDEVVGSLS